MLRARPRLPFRGLIFGLAVFSAVTAIGGGTELLLWPNGNPFVPIELLRNTPFATFVIPGLLLGLVVGGTSLVCAVLVWRRSRAAIDATLLAGGALSVWIAAELALFREADWLHFVFGALGLSILALGLWAAWRSRLPRHRWVITVTIAEAAGFLAPATAGILSARAGIEGWPQVGLLTAAGLIEGLLLGAGQAFAFPFAVRRWRYALLTSLAAGLVWGCVMSMTQLTGAAAVHPAVLGVAGVLLAVVGLGAIGTAQWFELRHHTPTAAAWIRWTALAWVVALPLSFVAGPLVEESTPIASHFVLWGCGGVLMAYVLALITWQGVQRVSGARSLRTRFLDDLAGAALPQPAGAVAPVTEADLADLPESAQRYFRFMGVLGRPRDTTFRLSFIGRFKVAPGAPWRTCEAWQYNTGPEVTRTFAMRMRFGGVPVIGRDTYRDGHGRMLVKLLDRLTVADAKGTEFDVGELSTYLNDCVLLAPSMLLVPSVSFSAVDASCFDLTLSDHGVTVKARVFIDERGAPMDFATTDRFLEDPKEKGRMMRAMWTTPVAGFQELDGRILPTRAKAIWHLPDGELPYAEFELVPGSVSFNVRPSD